MMDDPRFKHVASDPRFKSIPKKSRKVAIDSRFQSMFTDKQFKVKYKVDKRGRKLQQSSSEDLRKYYELEAGGEEKTEKSEREEITPSSDKGKGKLKSDVRLLSSDESFSSEENSDASSAEEEEDSSDEDDEGSCDLYLPSSTGGVEGEEEEENQVPLSEDTSHRIALCNMDWDHLGAMDIFILLNSFKPAGASIHSVTVYPSDFGLERMAKEDIQGPVGLGGGENSSDEGEEGEEGEEYSEEKLRKYQLSRFKYYYAVAVCDSVETAEHIYAKCNGLEYEHSGGQLDLRFIPDDMTFDDRQPKSTATEETITTGFVPTDFVSSALQQSKVKLQWDETDPHRLKVTQKKFTKDDVQSMDFNAYLASSSDSEGEGSGEEGESKAKALHYKKLLEDNNDADSANEVMEITWEPGLVESAEKIVKKKKKATDQATPWEKYLQRKKEKRQEVKRKTKHNQTAEDAATEDTGNQDAGFDDPFFDHSVTTATAGTTKKKGKRKRELDETEMQERDELELLVMSEGEEGEGGGGGKEHFSLDKILRSEKQPKKKRKKAKKAETAEAPVDSFKVDVDDPRFKALFESHLYAPDPSAPQYRATKGMMDIMEEKTRRGKERGVVSTSGGGGAEEEVEGGAGKKKAWSQDPATGQPMIQPSLRSLVTSVKAKARLYKDKKRKSLPNRSRK